MWAFSQNFQALDIAACDGPVRFHRVVNLMSDEPADKVCIFYKF